ncbi:uncharacterized protein LOC126419640 [Schistocerca serialis cubense]|uniref:uncharacterized protein LOC126419640 n=1 Tax=Schistocerca serialis cubense TaxID=2023355 RepID=UPI00214E8628|nr:uncharacterized protein LOC126419640 [Schistocerca serialis cubense]
MEKVRKKEVHFPNEACTSVHILNDWDFSVYREARIGLCWQRAAIDSLRFKQRIEQMCKIISPILDDAHRQRIAKARQNIRRKMLSLHKRETETKSVLEKTFKPISQPLKELIHRFPARENNSNSAARCQDKINGCDINEKYDDDDDDVEKKKKMKSSRKIQELCIAENAAGQLAASYFNKPIDKTRDTVYGVRFDPL